MKDKFDTLISLAKANGWLNTIRKFMPRFITNRSMLILDNDWRLYRKYKKKYRELIKVREPVVISSSKKVGKIYTMWQQGEDNAPALVKTCFRRMKELYGEDNVVILTDNNIKNYIIIPEYLKIKYEKGIIPRAQYSDIVRTMILCEYGGTWIDATCYLSSKLPAEILNSPIFVFQHPKSYVGVHKGSNWFIHSERNSPILTAVKSMLFEYWRTSNILEDYFIWHVFFSIAVEANVDAKKEWSQVPYYNNDSPHILQHELNRAYDENRFKNICRLSSIHKLSWKLKNADNIFTFYDYLTKH